MGANMSLERPGLSPESPRKATHLSCISYVIIYTIFIVRNDRAFFPANREKSGERRD
jgi:hypothetical protein